MSMWNHSGTDNDIIKNKWDHTLIPVQWKKHFEKIMPKAGEYALKSDPSLHYSRQSKMKSNLEKHRRA